MRGLNTFTLKIIAIVSMLVDHIGHIFFPEVMIFRIIGRISFPIFAYVLVEGIHYTKDITKYMLRLGIFALLSEIPYDLAIMGSVLEFSHQNVFFTLFFAVLMFWAYKKIEHHGLKTGALVVIFLLGIFVCQYLNTDYCDIGILLIFAFYMYRDKKVGRLVLAGALFLGLTGGLQLYALLALPLIALHNGEQGPKMKSFFYLFYPAHLLILYIVHLIV